MSDNTQVEQSAVYPIESRFLESLAYQTRLKMLGTIEHSSILLEKFSTEVAKCTTF